MALTEEQLELLGERLMPLFQELERAVINDVARRLTATGKLTETAEIMAETLRDKGYSPSAIYTQVMRAVGADELLQREIAINTRQLKAQIVEEVAGLRERIEGESDMWVEVGNMAFRNDLSVWKSAAKPVKGSAFEKLVEAAKKRATDEVLNLTKSLGFHTSTGMNVRAERIYRHELNLALTKVCSGAYSFDQAVEEAVREMAKSGLRVVDFESGVTRQIDTAARNAVRTAASQLAGEISMQNARDTDCNHVEVSAHWGAREGEGHANHAGWQGKIYCIEGTDGVYENLEQATGYPSDPKGLKGYNCRHDFYPFWPGLSEPNTWPPEPEPVTVNGRRYTYYQATQEQRRRERGIRALKREESALKSAGLDDKAKEDRGRIRTKTAEYREFSDAVGIRPKENRLRVCESGSAKIKPLKNVPESSTILPSTNDGGGGVNYICRVDKRLYECVSGEISTDEVVITDKQIEHSNRHMDAYEKYKHHIEQTLQAPDYIFADKHPNTGLIVKRIPDVEGRSLEIVLRIKISSDPEEYKNSIISCWDISESRLRNYVRNKKILYRADDL